MASAAGIRGCSASRRMTPVVLGERRHAVAGLLGAVGKRPPFPEQQRNERAPEAVGPQIAGDARRERGRAPDPPAPVLPVVWQPESVRTPPACRGSGGAVPRPLLSLGRYLGHPLRMRRAIADAAANP